MQWHFYVSAIQGCPRDAPLLSRNQSHIRRNNLEFKNLRGTTISQCTRDISSASSTVKLVIKFDIRSTYSSTRLFFFIPYQL